MALRKEVLQSLSSVFLSSSLVFTTWVKLNRSVRLSAGCSPLCNSLYFPREWGQEKVVKICKHSREQLWWITVILLLQIKQIKLYPDSGGYWKALQHLLSTWNTILQEAACLKISSVSTVPKLRYFMEKGKVWTCNVIYMDKFPKYSNPLTWYTITEILLLIINYF